MSLCDMVAFRAALIPAEWAVGFSGRWLANLEDKFAATVHAVVRSFTSAGRVDGHRAGAGQRAPHWQPAPRARPGVHRGRTLASAIRDGMTSMRAEAALALAS